MSSSPGINFYLVCYIQFFWIWRVLFGFEVEFGDSINLEVLSLGVFGICVSVGWS